MHAPCPNRQERRCYSDGVCPGGPERDDRLIDAGEKGAAGILPRWRLRGDRPLAPLYIEIGARFPPCHRLWDKTPHACWPLRRVNPERGQREHRLPDHDGALQPIVFQECDGGLNTIEHPAARLVATPFRSCHPGIVSAQVLGAPRLAPDGQQQSAQEQDCEPVRMSQRILHLPHRLSSLAVDILRAHAPLACSAWSHRFVGRRNATPLPPPSTSQRWHRGSRPRGRSWAPSWPWKGTSVRTLPTPVISLRGPSVREMLEQQSCQGGGSLGVLERPFSAPAIIDRHHQDQGRPQTMIVIRA